MLYKPEELMEDLFLRFREQTKALGPKSITTSDIAIGICEEKKKYAPLS